MLDPKTRLMLYKLVNGEVLEAVNGCISTGKEACVFHANGGRLVKIIRRIKMVSTEHSSNIGKNKDTKKTCSMVTVSIQLRRTNQNLSSQADLAREK